MFISHAQAESMAERLKGAILLQVEENGEAWYVDPVTLERAYLKDGGVAYNALRDFGLGISNNDINKIPVGVESRFEDVDSDNDGLADKLEEGLKTNPDKLDTDADGVSDGLEVLNNNTNPLGVGNLIYDNNLINKLKGRILLQVESRGEAWYLNPKDGKRYYMKDGDAAYQIMRFLSLGITNSDLNKIEIKSGYGLNNLNPNNSQNIEDAQGIIEGLAYINASAMRKNWDSDSEYDGLEIDIVYYDTSGNIISDYTNVLIPINVDVKLYSAKYGDSFNRVKDRLVFDGHFKSEDVINNSSIYPILRIPREKMDVKETDETFGILDVTLHTPSQGDFSVTKDSLVRIKIDD